VVALSYLERIVFVALLAQASRYALGPQLACKECVARCTQLKSSE